jgi:hypothetical protein
MAIMIPKHRSIFLNRSGRDVLNLLSIKTFFLVWDHRIVMLQKIKEQSGA